MAVRHPRPRYDQAMPHTIFSAGGGIDRSASFGSRGSPYGDGLARRNGAVTRDSYSLGGVSGATGARPGSVHKVFTLAVGMDSVAQDCRCNGLRQTFAVGGDLQDELVASQTHRAAEDIEAIVRSGVDVPPWAAKKLERAAVELGDIRTILAARLALGRGERLTPEQAMAFQAAAIRQGLLRGKRGRTRGKRRAFGVGAALAQAPAREPCFNHITGRIEGGPFNGAKPHPSQVELILSQGRAYVYIPDGPTLDLRLCRRAPAKRKKKGLGAMLIGACCGAVDSVLSVGGKKRKKMIANGNTAMQLARQMSATPWGPQPLVDPGMLGLFAAQAGAGGVDVEY